MNLLHGQDLLATHKHFEQGEEIPFKHVRPLGRGAFGVVDEVEYLQGRPGAATNAPATYARKVVQNTGSLHNYRMIQDEIDLLKRLRHKHVVRLLTTYSVERQYAIIMSPVADTNLRDYLASAQQEDKIYQWFGCLSAGLAYVHSQQIRHRDIKPANILVKGDSVLFTDFGIAKDFSEDATTSSTGTVDAKCYMYCAPEVAAEKPRGRPSDMFSLGCVFLEMVTVLMGQATISLSRLHESVTAHGRKAYHASLGKVQQWILTLCVQIAADAWGCLQSDNGFMLEWCFAILHPDPASRLSARSLYRLIQDVDSRVVRQRRFVATCCKIMRAEARSSESRGKTQFRLFERWPTAAFIPGDGEAKRWSDVAEQLGYKLPEGSYDDAVD
ncbi:kinase-like protein [Lepidopterella palustris CBS 459.81]|uniref:non-specific serine/threonine protein kinase n=1 Tax=Lepidopterella palustris CBS 459.81 TaxID=1314670 RepID=A0A8E2JAA9_9PEZI|nr:kinase-like protein [Lepidopterella palustris CBS 459.81]